MGVITRVKTVFATKSDYEQSEGEVGWSSRLYYCDSCGTTYVSEEKEFCSQCKIPVENVPTEQDLGYS
jgi:hypothetical protein